MNNTYTIKVFIADDHPVIVQGVKTMLRNHLLVEIVGTAHSGDEMYRLLPAAKPHVLLLDLNMPGKDFYENIAWVKDHLPWVKILPYSAYYSPDLVRSLLQVGARGYLPKTVNDEELCEAIVAVQRGEIFVGSIAHCQSDIGTEVEHPHLPDDFRKRLGLSRREQEVLQLISRGLSSQRIGKTLFISKHTVETHRKNILRKLDFNSSTELVKFAVQHGLV